MSNQYTGIYGSIANYYDLVLKTSNIDYQETATVAHSIMGDYRKILEVGIGTGLLAEKLLDIEPKYQYTGVDIAPTMLELAQKKLGERANLIQANFLDTELNDKFDVVISSAGIWMVLEQEDEYYLWSYLMDIQDNIAGLQKVAQCLHPNVFLLLSCYQASTCLGMRKNRENHLEKDITYTSQIEEEENNSDFILVAKNHFVKQGDKIIAQEKIKHKFFKTILRNKIMRTAGFELQKVYKINEYQKWYLYQILV